MPSFDHRAHASRRRILTSLAALGASAVLPGAVRAQTAAPSAAAKPPSRSVIDCHFHYYPPEYKAAWQGFMDKTGQPPLPPLVRTWTPQWAVDQMDKAGIAISVLSLPSTPALWFRAVQDGMQQMSRLCTEFAPQIVRAYPRRCS